MLPTLPKLRMLSKLLALSRPARLPVAAPDGVRFRLERVDLRMVVSRVLGGPSRLVLRQSSSIASRPACRPRYSRSSVFVKRKPRR
jgi:hypothetical protein